MICPPTFLDKEGLITNLLFTTPIKVISEANNYDHWNTKRKRKAAQADEITYELHNALDGKKIRLPCTVGFTRIGPKALDTDNLQSAFKSIRDAIAKKIGADDGEVDKIRFTYNQEPCGIRKYLVKVQITSDAK